MCYEIFEKAFKEADARFANGGVPGGAKPTGKQNLMTDLAVKMEIINKKLDAAKSDEKRAVLNAKRHFFEAIKNELEGKPHLNDQYLCNSEHFDDGGDIDGSDDGRSSLKKPGAAAPKKGKMKEEPFAPKVKDVKVGGKRKKASAEDLEEVKNEEVIDEEEEEEEEDEN